MNEHRCSRWCAQHAAIGGPLDDDAPAAPDRLPGLIRWLYRRGVRIPYRLLDWCYGRMGHNHEDKRGAVVKFDMPEVAGQQVVNETRVMGPCTQCGTSHKACTGPDWCCEECLHLDASWDGYEAIGHDRPGDRDQQQAAEVWPSQEPLADWEVEYAHEQRQAREALTEALRVHHPIMRSETGPFSGCRCGQVRLGEDVIAHVVSRLVAERDEWRAVAEMSTEAADRWNAERDEARAERDAIAAALAAARAEEAARWRAKIEALIAFYDRHEYSSVSVDDLRAVLDAS